MARDNKNEKKHEQISNLTEETYNRVCVQLNKLPEWKKQVYNNNFLKSNNSKKLV